MSRCENCVFPQEKCVTIDQIQPSDIMIITDMPTHRDLAKNTFLSGSDGRLMFKLLEEFNIPKDDIHITSMLNCRSPKGKVPTKKEAQACFPRLEQEIKECQPKYIITLGAISAKYLLKTSRAVKDLRGRIYWKKEYNSYVVPMLNLRQCLVSPDLTRDLIHDLQKLSRCLNGWIPPKITPDMTLVPEELKTDYTLINKVSPAIETLVYLRKNYDLLCLDLETTGFHRRNCKVLCMGISYAPEKAIILGEDLWESKRFLKALNDFFDKSGSIENVGRNKLRFLWQHGKFDLKFLRHRYGITNARIDEDTLVQHYLIDERKGNDEEGRGVHDLQYLSGYYLNAPFYEDSFKEYVKPGESYASAPPDKLHQYCAYDVDFCRKIHFHILNDDEWDSGLEKVTKEILVPGANLLSDVEDRGILVDQDYLTSLQEKFEQKLEEIEYELTRIAEDAGWDVNRYQEESEAKSTPDSFNPNSPPQVGYVLIDLLGLPKYRNKRTTNKDAMSYWKTKILSGEESERSKFVNKLLEFRSESKLYSQYIKGMWKHIEDDGRIRSNYNQHGTSTGRLSSSYPNLQNISSRSEIRNIFVPTPGWHMMEVDLSQAELRVLAVLSKDPFLMDVYENNKDLHDTMAEELFGPNFTYQERRVAKAVDFGIVYDQSAASLAEDLNIPIADAQHYINGFLNKASKAHGLLKQCAKKPRQNGVITTKFGRKMRFSLITKYNKDNLARTARNFPIQSISSDLHVLAGYELWKDIRHSNKVYIVNLIHDSLLLETHPSVTKAVGQRVKYLLESIPVKLLNSPIPFKADVDCSTRGWGSMITKQESEPWDEYLDKLPARSDEKWNLS